MSVIGRMLFTFMVGAVAGAGGMGWLFYSGAADFVLKTAPVVQDLETRLEEVEGQRNQLGRQLEDLAKRSGESEARFKALEQRLRSLGAKAAAAAAEPAPSTPPAPTPSVPAATGLDPESE